MADKLSCFVLQGVGMFWTLERGDKHWREEVAKARELQIAGPAPNDVSRAWELVDETQRREFEKERARLYLGRTDDASVDASRDFYSTVITYAAQVGLALTWAVLRDQNATTNPDTILDVVITGVNRSLAIGPVASRDRKLILRKEGTDSFNQLPRMDASFAAYFRFFWMELLLVEHNQQELASAGINVDGAKELLLKGRKFYLLAIADKHAASHKSTHEDWSMDECVTEGRTTAISSLAKSYHKWFGGATDEWREKLRVMIHESVTLEVSAENGGDPEAPTETGEI